MHKRRDDSRRDRHECPRHKYTTCQIRRRIPVTSIESEILTPSRKHQYFPMWTGLGRSVSIR